MGVFQKLYLCITWPEPPDQTRGVPGGSWQTKQYNGLVDPGEGLVSIIRVYVDNYKKLTHHLPPENRHGLIKVSWFE